MEKKKVERKGRGKKGKVNKSVLQQMRAALPSCSLCIAKGMHAAHCV